MATVLNFVSMLNVISEDAVLEVIQAGGETAEDKSFGQGSWLHVPYSDGLLSCRQIFQFMFFIFLFFGANLVYIINLFIL